MNFLNQINEIDFCIINDNCLAFEQVCINLKSNILNSNYHHFCCTKLIEKQFSKKNIILILDFQCLLNIEDENNLYPIKIPEHIPIILFVKKNIEVNSSLLVNKEILKVIVYPCCANEILSKIESLFFKPKLIRSKNKLDDYIDVTKANDVQFVENLEKVIILQLEIGDISINSIASKLSMNSKRLNNMVKTITGITMVKYLLKFRLQLAKTILETENENIQGAAIRTCFSSFSYFTKSYKKQYGILPSKQKK